VITPLVGFFLWFFIQAGAGSIEGVVTSATTLEPIAGAQVTATKMPPPLDSGARPLTGGITVGGVLEQGIRPQPLSVTSDSNGRFLLQGLAAGTYLLRVAADGYARQQFAPQAAGQIAMSTSIILNEGQNIKDVTFSLLPAGNVSGRITGANGQPLANIEVALLRSMYDADGKRFVPTATGLTDDRGEYRLFWVPPGRYYLSAGSPSRPTPGRMAFLAPGMNRFPRTFYPDTTDPSAALVIDVQPGGEINGMDFRLSEQAVYRVRGRVIDTVSAQIPGNVNVSITPRNSLVMSGTSSSGIPYNPNDGTFELREVPSGSYWIIAQLSAPVQRQPGGPPPRFPTGISAVDVAGADVDGVAVTVMPPVNISGRVHIDGQPLPAEMGVAIILSNPQPGFGPLAIPFPAKATSDGSFQVEGVHPGQYRVNVVGLPSGPEANVYVKEARFGSIDALSQILAITGPVSDELQIVLARNAGRITGTVTDNLLRLSASIQVALVPDLRERRDLYKLTSSDAGGKFSFGAIPPGRYKLFSAAGLDVGAFYDPDVIRQFESVGTPVTIGDSSNITVQLKLNLPSR
jgi:hypothetical protein